jgi:hypothetical protein
MKALTGTQVLLLVLAAASQAAFVKQPYLQNLMDTSIVVRWETSTAQPGRVQYGLTTVYGLEVNHSNSTTQHELRLPTLLRDTLYHYRAISGNDTSADATFHTPVTVGKPFRFFDYGDTQDDSTAHQSVVNRMLLVSPVPGLAIHTGDLTASGTAAEYRTFFNVERDLLKRVALFPGIGNHDTTNMTNWFALFALPNNERWYSFRYGNSAFHILDNYSPDTLGTPQYNWFLSELRADSADPGVRHIFVFFHEPPYTTNTAYSGNLRARRHLCPLLERFRVRLTFQGHVHAYEHSLVNGVHYLISGGGGGSLATGWGAWQPWTVYRDAIYEFALVDVRGDTVFSRGIRTDGTGFDTLTLIAPPSGVAERKPAGIQPALSLKTWPNPFSDRLALSFALPRSEQAWVMLYNASGQRVATLAQGVLPAGEHQACWKAREAASGVYFCVLRTPEAVRVIRLTRVR